MGCRGDEKIEDVSRNVKSVTADVSVVNTQGGR